MLPGTSSIAFFPLFDDLEGLITLPLLKLIALTCSFGFFTVSLGMEPTDRLASCADRFPTCTSKLCMAEFWFLKLVRVSAMNAFVSACNTVVFAVNVSNIFSKLDFFSCGG
jgi:hypothetical protein